MGTKVAVLDFTYSLTGVSEVTPKSAVIAPSSSSKTKITGKGVYRGTITLTFAPGTLSAAAFTFSGTNTLPAVFTINPANITRLKVDGKTALGENDASSEVLVTGTMTSGDSTAPATVPATVKISAAGQDKVGAE